MNSVTPWQQTAISNMDNDVETKLKQFVRDRDAFSPNTWKQIVQVTKNWTLWANQHGYPWFPAQPEHLREWMIWQDRQGLAASTIRTRLTSLNIVHVNAGLDAPGRDKVVNRAMRMITRSAVHDGEEQGQAIPLQRNDLEAIAGKWKGSARLQELRDLAFVGVAYNTMLRVAEVGRIRMRDIKFNSDGTALIRVGHTKTSLTSTGILKNLSPLVTAYVRAWVDAAGLADKPGAMLFCRVHRVNRAVPGEKPMSNEALIAIFERAWLAVNDHREEANKGRYETWTGHSCRVGACIDLLEAGTSLEQIMIEGNWASPEMVLHYLRHALAGRSHLSALLSR